MVTTTTKAWMPNYLEFDKNRLFAPLELTTTVANNPAAIMLQVLAMPW